MKIFQSWMYFQLKIPYIPWLNTKGHRHPLQSPVVLMAQKGSCTHLVQLSAQPLDRLLLQSWGKIKASERQFTHFQREIDNCDLEPFLKGFRFLKETCIQLQRPKYCFACFLFFSFKGGILIEQQWIVPDIFIIPMTITSIIYWVKRY